MPRWSAPLRCDSLRSRPRQSANYHFVQVFLATTSAPLRTYLYPFVQRSLSKEQVLDFELSLSLDKHYPTTSFSAALAAIQSTTSWRVANRLRAEAIPQLRRRNACNSRS